jgi:RND family efflux transporter MFP subunit
MTPRHLLLVRSIGLLSLACVIAGCHSGDGGVTKPPPPPVSVRHPVLRTVVDHDDYQGQIVARKSVPIRTRSRGFLIKVNFKDGQVVEEGRLLYEIDPQPYKAALQAAEAQERGADGNMQYAKSEYARVRQLARKGGASREELEVWIAKENLAESDKLKAQAAVTKAKLDLGYTRVKAPFTGRVSRTQVEEGTLINSGGGDTLLTTIVSVGPIYVSLNIDENSLMRYRRHFGKEKTKDGKEPRVEDLKIPVYVRVAGEEGYPHQGLLVYGDPQVNPSTGTLEVRGLMPNKSGLLQDGMSARVRIPVSDPHKAMLIPEQAVGNEQGRKFVYVVNKNNKVERRPDDDHPVVFDRVVDGMQVVTSGLTEEDWVIVEGILRVRVGLVVEPKKPKEPARPEPKPAVPNRSMPKK